MYLRKLLITMKLINVPIPVSIRRYNSEEADPLPVLQKDVSQQEVQA